MLTRNTEDPGSVEQQAGFTLVELAVAIVIIAVLAVTFLTLFKSTLFNYLNLQSDATAVTQIDSQAARVAMVLRGATDLTTVAANDMVLYSYFYPSDSYVSVLHYYLQTTGNVTLLKAEVTPMTANPPIGTPITANKRTYTIIDNYYQPSGGTLFTYLDSGGAALTLPISDLQTIKGLQVNLAAKTSGGNTSINVQVSLRNRKTNL